MSDATKKPLPGFARIRSSPWSAAWPALQPLAGGIFNAITNLLHIAAETTGGIAAGSGHGKDGGGKKQTAEAEHGSFHNVGFF